MQETNIKVQEAIVLNDKTGENRPAPNL